MDCLQTRPLCSLIHLQKNPAGIRLDGRKRCETRYEWVRIFFENGEKKLRFETANTDTCG